MFRSLLVFCVVSSKYFAILNKGGVQGGVWAKMFNTGSQFQYILTGLSAKLVAGVFQCCTCPCVSRWYFSVLWLVKQTLRRSLDVWANEMKGFAQSCCLVSETRLQVISHISWLLSCARGRLSTPLHMSNPQATIYISKS